MGKAHDRSAQTGSVGWVSPSVAEARQESKHPSVASLYRSFADAEEAAAAAQQEALAELQPMLQLFGKRGELGEILFTKAALLEAVLVQRFDRLREQAETLFHAPDPGAAFFDFFSHLVADAAGKIAIAEALFEAGGDNGGDAAQARTDCVEPSMLCFSMPNAPAPSEMTSNCPRCTPCSLPHHEPPHTPTSRKRYETGC